VTPQQEQTKWHFETKSEDREVLDSVVSLEASEWNITRDVSPVITMRANMCSETPTVSDETRLISLIVSGETDLFYDLIRPHEHRLRRVALAVVRNETDAEDVVQETLLKAFRNLSGFRADSRLSTWLISIVLNEAKGHLRRRGLLAFEPIEANCERFWNATDELSNPYYMAERSQVKEIVSRALSGLHPRYRNIYFLREVHELSTQRAAEQLGISLSVAKTRLHRARHLLQDRLNVLMGIPLTRRGHLQVDFAMARNRPGAGNIS
jgi:RNA polymerase sigma-70 factor (ECF subfamily)